jgi:hypothetical protein
VGAEPKWHEGEDLSRGRTALRDRTGAPAYVPAGFVRVRGRTGEDHADLYLRAVPVSGVPDETGSADMPTSVVSS